MDFCESSGRLPVFYAKALPLGAASRFSAFTQLKALNMTLPRE
jgi:hypothetical protein